MSQKIPRIVYSFPHRLGAARICYIGWQQVNGLAAAGANPVVFPGSLSRPVSDRVQVVPTLSRGRVRIPYRLLGSLRAFALHDYIVSRRIERLAGQIDIIHTWPLGATRTLRTAARLGIPTVLERPNAHTRFAYEVVRAECERLGVTLPPGYEHAYNPVILRKEEEEYKLAYRLLCPSDFTVKTFLDLRFPRERLVRHTYGYDEASYYPNNRPREEGGLRMLFVGVCAVRKGLHHALEAWLKSPARHHGTFTIAGEFLPAYREKLASLLLHPSVRVLGHRNDVPELMRQSDILVLPSIEEGFGIVITDAMGSGCVTLCSEACTDVCKHMENGLVHQVGDVDALASHITMLHEDRALLERLKKGALRHAPEHTWTKAGVKLLEVYREVIASYAKERS